MAGFISVKNFETFQHYKDRNPPWIKLYNTCLRDYEFGELPDAAKWHLVGIWSLASQNSNKLPNDSAWIAKQIGAKEQVDIALLVRAGFIVEHVASKPIARRKRSATPETEAQDQAEKDSPQVATQPRPLGGVIDPPIADPPFLPDEPPGDKRARRRDEFGADFAAWWPQYPRRIGKDAAERAYAKARKNASAAELLAGVMRFGEERRGEDPKFTPHPATWLNAGRWKDQPDGDPDGPRPRGPKAAKPNVFDDVITRAARAAMADGPGGFHDGGDRAECVAATDRDPGPIGAGEPPGEPASDDAADKPGVDHREPESTGGAFLGRGQRDAMADPVPGLRGGPARVPAGHPGNGIHAAAPVIEMVAQAGGDFGPCPAESRGPAPADRAAGPAVDAAVEAAQRGEGPEVDGHDSGAAGGLRPAHRGAEIEVADAPRDDLTDDPWVLYESLRRKEIAR